MRLLTLAAGLATGYVLGTRAGRPKYNQIVANARLVRANPTAGQAITAVTNLFGPAEAQPAPEEAVTTMATPGDAEDATGMAEGLIRLMDPLVRVTMIGRGQARAAAFSWNETAARTVEAYRQAIG